MKYRRLLLKISGESLAGDSKRGIDASLVEEYASIVARLADNGHEVGIVIGGGNFWRGRTGGEMDRVAADRIGMLATVMNSIAITEALTRRGHRAHLMTAVPMPTVGDPVDALKAKRYLEDGHVVVFAGGTGNPFFSTDSAAALRAAEINADIILKATLVDGVYDKDPHVHSDAVMFKELTFDEVLERRLGVMDATAAALCRDYGQKVVVFNIDDLENIIRVAAGEPIGTLVR
ncbi:MAG TPA: UMP kinase [Clostridiaceae bacterium]|jgi:uridylate kinase|nr:UMP kinase [Clostridiaceae bacterium]